MMCGKAQHVLIHDVLVIGQYLFIDVLVIRSPAQLPTSQRGTQHPAAARPAAVGESPVDEAPTPPLVEEALADFGEDDGAESEEAKIMAEELFGTAEPLPPQSTKAPLVRSSMVSRLLAEALVSSYRRTLFNPFC